MLVLCHMGLFYSLELLGLISLILHDDLQFFDKNCINSFWYGGTGTASHFLAVCRT